MTETGRFISIEGGDGTGKSTQAARLAERLRSVGLEVVETREPGGTTGAERIRSLILDGSLDRWSPVSELLLFSAARRDHCERVIFPALERGAVVISDRFHDSTSVYQCAAHGADHDLFRRIHRQVIGLVPDRTVVLLLDPSAARSRLNERGGKATRFEQRGHGFDIAVHRAYVALCEREPVRCRALEASGDPATVGEAVWNAVCELFPGAPR